MADNLTPEQRSYCMSRIKGKDTKPELLLRSTLHRNGYRFRKHVQNLPGKPDIVFTKAKVAVFIDGEFWHGYQFDQWRDTVSAFWQEKIGKNMARDTRNFANLEAQGWTVVRVWQKEVEKDLESVVKRIRIAITSK